MKKIILGLIVTLLFASTGNVFAAQLHFGFTDYNTSAPEVQREVAITEGWNLIHGFANPEWITGGDISQSNIKALFILNPVTKTYARFYPNPIRDEVDQLSSVPDMVAWVYSDKTGTMKFKTVASEVLKFNWPAGWNMIGVTGDFVGKSLNQLKGNCTITSYYVWQADSQKWYKDSKGLDAYFGKEWVGKGVLIKFAQDCKLGLRTNTNTVSTPPPLPSNEVNIENNSSASLIINRNFGSFAVNRVLGKEYVDREYHSFPLSNVVTSDAIKYGQDVGVNAIVFKFNQNASQFFPQVLSVYKDADWSKLAITNNMQVYELSQNVNKLNRVAIWTSGNYLVLIHTSDGFHGDIEDIVKAYQSKYPSN